MGVVRCCRNWNVLGWELGGVGRDCGNVEWDMWVWDGVVNGRVGRGCGCRAARACCDSREWVGVVSTGMWDGVFGCGDVGVAIWQDH